MSKEEKNSAAEFVPREVPFTYVAIALLTLSISLVCIVSVV